MAGVHVCRPSAPGCCTAVYKAETVITAAHTHTHDVATRQVEGISMQQVTSTLAARTPPQEPAWPGCSCECRVGTNTVGANVSGQLLYRNTFTPLGMLGALTTKSETLSPFGPHCNTSIVIAANC